MKKDKIYAMLRKHGSIYLYNKKYSDGKDGEKIAEQYVSDGPAIYVLENLPLFDEKTICGLIGLKTEDADVEFEDFPEELLPALEFQTASDIPLRREPFDAFGYAVFTTDSRDTTSSYKSVVHFIDHTYLAPIDAEDVSYVSRELPDFRAVIVREGMFVKAVIAPKVFHHPQDRIKFLDKIRGQLLQFEAEDDE